MSEIQSLHDQLHDHIKDSDTRFKQSDDKQDATILLVNDVRQTLEQQNRDMKILSEKLEPILDIWRAALASKSFITGLGAIVMAVTAIGVGFIWLINSIHR